ncbi:MAG: response regulator [Nitrospira sp.]|nr:response regulator [Nitrospira sp.]
MIVATPSRAQARRLLVVADSPDAQTAILEYAHTHGHSVISASTPGLGLSTFDMTQPDLVFIDLLLPGQEGLSLVAQIRERRPSCPVVLLTDAGHVELTMEGLRAGASDYVHQPVCDETLAQVVQRAIHRLPARVDDMDGIERLEYHLVMVPDPNAVEGMVTWLLQRTAMGLVEVRLLHLRSALQELIMNAVEHGCLELRYHDKIESVENDRYDELIHRRRGDARFRDRRVSIRAIVDIGQRLLTYQIADGGKGFNWKSRLHADTDVCPTGDASGRGIFLARSFFPDLSYNDRGNEVTFTVPLG